MSGGLLTVVAPVAAAAAGQRSRARAVTVTRTVAYAFVVGMLGFGLLPVVQAVGSGRPLWQAAAGAVVFVAVAACFVRLVGEAMRRPWRGRGAGQAVAVTALVLALPPLLDPAWLVLGFLPAAAVAVTLRPLHGLSAAVGALAAVSVERAALGVGHPVFRAVQDVLTAAALAGIIVLVAFVEELYVARAEVARLAVTAERSRFARDLHDTLGHNLSAIALKSELALRLMAEQPARARTELSDVHAIARASLQDVRAVVKGYRRDSLPREVQGAQSVLAAAGVECRVSTLPAGLPTPAEEALAWAVREAATNLLRHSDASRCDITVTRGDGEVRLDVTNDGAAAGGPADPAGGSGLAGLAERLGPLGGTVAAGASAAGEFRLTVRIPVSDLGPGA